MNAAWKSFARLAATLAVVAGSHAAQAQPSNLVTYFFSGNCSSCAAEAGRTSFSVMARLTLQNYVPGDAILVENIQSLWYTGSNLVDTFTVTAPGGPLPAGRVFGTDTIQSTSGQLGPTASSLAFDLEFGNGLFVRTQADGAWSICAPKGSGYSGGNACFSNGADFGTGRWMITQVPEPSMALMLAGGLAALMLLRRRRRAD